MQRAILAGRVSGYLHARWRARVENAAIHREQSYEGKACGVADGMAVVQRAISRCVRAVVHPGEVPGCASPRAQRGGSGKDALLIRERSGERTLLRPGTAALRSRS